MVRVRALAQAKARIRERWPHVRIRRVEHVGGASFAVGAQLRVKTEVDLAGLRPDDVAVEVYHGTVSPEGEFLDGQATPMALVHHNTGETACLFEAAVRCERSGLYGFSVRLLPKHPDLAEPRATSLIHWATDGK
jgi:starch phosphorylase